MTALIDCLEILRMLLNKDWFFRRLQESIIRDRLWYVCSKIAVVVKLEFLGEGTNKKESFDRLRDFDASYLVNDNYIL